jgi:hypothetical protein
MWKLNMNRIGITLMISVGTFLGCKDNQKGRVYFGNLMDGVKISSPFKVEMKSENLIVEPNSHGVMQGHGHMLLIIDAPIPNNSAPIQRDSNYIHFDEAGTDTVLNLKEGKHTLALYFAKGNELPYNPPIYQLIHLEVIKTDEFKPIKKTDTVTIDTALAL